MEPTIVIEEGNRFESAPNFNAIAEAEFAGVGVEESMGEAVDQAEAITADAAAKDVQPAQAAPEKTGIMSGITEFARQHPTVAKFGLALGLVGAVGAAAPAVASGHGNQDGKAPAPISAEPFAVSSGANGPGALQRLSGGDASASASEATATASVAHTWSVLGGDPFVDGGVHSKEKLEHIFKSARGQEALRDEGLNDSEVQATIDAVDNSDGDRDVRGCTLHTGDHFKEMVFGETGIVESNVTYTGESAPAYCVDVKMPNGKVIMLKIPKKCANISLIREEMHKPPTKTPPPKHPKKLAPVFLAKDALTANDDLLDPTPSDTFQALVKCRQYGKMVTNNVTINEGPNGEPVFALKCNIGTKVTAKEGPTMGPDKWETLNNAFQKQTVRKKGNIFTFKDRQVRDIPPPPTPTHKPVVNLIGAQHVLVGDKWEFCEFESDVDGDISSRSFSETGNGNIISLQPYPGNEPGEWCTMYQAGSYQDNGSVTATVVDRAGNTASDTEYFPIYDPDTSDDGAGAFNVIQ